MQGVAAVPPRFVEPTPEHHRAKKRAHRAGIFAATTIETALQLNPRPRLVVRFGLQTIERPGHNPSSHRTKQYAQLKFKGHGGFRCRLGLDKVVNEPSAPGERTRKLHNEGRKCRCQKGLGWRRMDHRGLQVRVRMEVEGFHHCTKGAPSKQPYSRRLDVNRSSRCRFPLPEQAMGNSAITPAEGRPAHRALGLDTPGGQTAPEHAPATPAAPPG